MAFAKRWIEEMILTFARQSQDPLTQAPENFFRGHEQDSNPRLLHRQRRDHIWDNRWDFTASVSIISSIDLSTFLSWVKRSAGRRWCGDWAEWVSPVLLLATSDFPAISHLTRNLTRECYYSRTFTLFSKAIPWVRKSVAISQTMHGLLWEDLRGE